MDAEQTIAEIAAESVPVPFVMIDE